jgi:hypothetical protein
MPIVEQSGIRLEYPLEGQTEAVEAEALTLRARVSPPHVNNLVSFAYQLGEGPWLRTRAVRTTSGAKDEVHSLQVALSGTPERFRYFAFVQRGPVTVPAGAELTASSDALALQELIVEVPFERRSRVDSEYQAPAKPATEAEPSKRPPQKLQARINALTAFLPNRGDQQAVERELTAAEGDFSVARQRLEGTLEAPTLERISFAHSLAEWTSDNTPLVKALAAQPTLTSLRDVALKYDGEKLAALVQSDAVPPSTPGETPAEKAKNFAAVLQRQLFVKQTSAVLQRMARDAELPIGDGQVREGVARFLDNQPSFNIRQTSLHEALRSKHAFEGIAAEHHPAVLEQLKTLQRVQAIATGPAAVPVLMNAKLTSAFQVAEMPQAKFVQAYGELLGSSVAREIHTSAVSQRMRNEQALVTLRDAVRGAGLAIIDGPQTHAERLANAEALVKEKGVPLNLETLFGSLDYCECDECLSVYSPAAYFVELLQYLRNNNLDPENPNSGQPGFADTPLEMLFRRRPDLGCLELSCENTFTVLPYVDLVNEVMESFLVHEGKYHADTREPKQTTLDAFNVEGETTGELLAEAQHTHYEAYCILKSAVYPFTLPYHQPLDAERVFLEYLETSRFELVNTYRTASADCPSTTLGADATKELQAVHELLLQRAADAEYLGLSQEEYIIFTREAFWPKRYFELTQGSTITDELYRQKIGVKQPWQYYGYASEAEMLDKAEDTRLGLTFVRAQYLRRTGIQYTDLVELVKTRFVNPLLPEGRALAMLQSIRFSYRFLQSLVDTTSTQPKVRFAKLLEVLEENLPEKSEPQQDYHCGDCSTQPKHPCRDREELRRWVYCYFERIGQLIVLDSGEVPLLPAHGQVLDYPFEGPPELVGELHRDGRLVQPDGTVLRVTIEASADGPLAGSVEPALASGYLPVLDENGQYTPYYFYDGILYVGDEPRERVRWQPPQDSCNVEQVRLIHLDGSSVTSEEYDRMQRFLRLWRKLSWSIDDLDQALLGLGTERTPEADNASAEPAEPCEYVGFEVFQDDCAAAPPGSGGCDDGGDVVVDCPDPTLALAEIAPAFLHQLPAVKRLLERTGLSLPKLLAFWSNIGTLGEKSLYAQLFLTHNLGAIDSVFEGDANGNYLTEPTKISEHIPVLMAALKLKADDIEALRVQLALPDSLTLAAVSALYRRSVLLKLLRLRVETLPDVFALFGDPFRTAQRALALLESWSKMEDAGFTLRQLAFVVLDHDDTKRPLAPSQRAVLQLTKALYDGLVAIDKEHADLPAEPAEAASTELVRAKAGLIFDAAVVEGIAGLVDGTTVYATNAPLGLAIAVPEPLSRKLAYSDKSTATPPSAGIQITGILTEAERTQLKALSTNPGWSQAIDRAGKQAQRFFDDVLFGVFAGQLAEARARLLAGDMNDPADALAATSTGPSKRRYFLAALLPFLRKRLAQRFIVESMAASVGLEPLLTRALLSDVLVAGSGGAPALEVLEALHTAPDAAASGWKGFLIPNASDSYTFIVTSEKAPVALTLAGQTLGFPHQQDDPSNVWLSEPVPLQAGTLYALELAGSPVSALQWKTPTSPRAQVPSSSLLPDYSSAAIARIFAKLSKAAILATGFELDREEILHFQHHASDFAGFNLNSPTMEHWKRLESYASLRQSLPRLESRLVDLFAWCTTAADSSKLAERIAKATGWDASNIHKLLAPAHFDLLDPARFRNEVALLTLSRALVIAGKLAIDIDRLFTWAKPGSKFWPTHQIAEDIRKAIRARYDQTDWEQVVKPLSDKLRENQKRALISYLVVQPDLVDWGVVDADSLFEFFLIDVQMDACMETSRIKQALSSVQLFIQRALLGLESPYIESDVLDRPRWEWMQRFRVWEANRKVFLYPENWIVPELRDDKSAFFKELESELLQKDLNPQTVGDSLKNYLFKVDEVANLKVAGLYVERDTSGDHKLHVFARTRNAPYAFFYRYFDVDQGNWYPWERMQVDIPCYDVEADGKIKGHGTYLAPIVVDGRLLVFFPQFVKKTRTAEVKVKTGVDADGKDVYGRRATVKELGDSPFSGGGTSESWEIKLAFTEYRNKKWGQKQLSKDALYDEVASSTPSSGFVLIAGAAPAIDIYQFVPRTGANAGEAQVEVYRESLRGVFFFQRSQITSAGAADPKKTLTATTSFHYDGQSKIRSLQAVATETPNLTGNPYFKDSSSLVTITGESPSFSFTHEFADALLAKATSIEAVTQFYLEGVPASQLDDAFGLDQNNRYDELKRPHALYNWEADFHAPMILVDRLLKSQQYEHALSICHNVLNPFAAGTGKERFWQFPPFREVNAERVLERLFNSLQSGQADTDITEWREKPFQPHVVARRRPAAYMKWVAMKYIEILIAWGDQLFRQDTIETINQATQLYVLASHVFGPDGYKIPKRGKVRVQSYYSLLDKWDAFSNAMVELELAFPFSNQPPAAEQDSAEGLTNIFGSASALYFCIPDNPALRKLRETIDDRLFKIRHCENIEGVFRKLPLFEPPIDPALLVQAAAQGLSIASVLNDLNRPLPNYRFYYLLQKALEMCGELKSLGAAFLSAKEKGDAEAIARLRSGHEVALAKLVMEVRKHQLDEAEKALEALRLSRSGPVYRLQHSLKLIGEDLSNVPEEDGEFRELVNKIEAPIDEGGLKLIPFEKEELDKAVDAADSQLAVGRVESVASILHAIPTIGAWATPIGVGANLTLGGSNFGNAAQGIARWMQTDANNISFQSTNAARKAGFLRQLQDRVQQANVAGFEIKNIDRQLLTQQIRIAIAQQEITNQQQQMDNAQEMEEFLRSKYTGQELFSWMEGQLRTAYYQAYTLAYDLAKRAESAFRFERGLTASDFIRAGYWNAGRDGLLAGEGLHLALKQLEAAYQERRGHDFEVAKSVSLRQLDPLALLQLRESGRCEFSVPEVLFDMDFPGHYQRRIKSISLSIPCVVGPYVGVNCTARLLEHKYRVSALAKDKGDYLEKVGETDERFQTLNVPITAIAASMAQNDSGVFELNFRDERYLPFEGAGVISKWRLELPTEFRQFDYDSITDVVLTLRYTAIDGGDKLKRAAVGAVQEFIKTAEADSRERGLFVAFDLKHDFSSEWYRSAAGANGTRSVALSGLGDHLPVFTKGRPASKVLATDIYLVADSAIDAGSLKLTSGGADFGFADAPAVGQLKTFVAKGVGTPIADWQLSFAPPGTALEKLWLVVKYTLN